MTKVRKLTRFVLFLIAMGLLLPFDGKICEAADYNGQLGALIKNAETYSRQGDYAKALLMYNRAIKIAPDDPLLYYRRAAVYGRSGNYMSAINDLTLVINADEKNSKTRFPGARKFRAECFAVSGLPQKAVEDYTVLLRKNPSSGKLWYYLAEVFAVMHRNDLALEAIKRGLTTNSHWSGKLKGLQRRIMTGEKITLHPPFSN
jgi:tetratricopeptide (TPR) repeat protein